MERVTRAIPQRPSACWRLVLHPWFAMAVQVILLVVGTMGLTAFTVEQKLSHRLDPIGANLLVLAALSFALSRRWPLVAFALSLGATLAYVALGFPQDGPFVLGAMAALGAAVVPTDPARSVALGGVTLVIFVLVTGTFTSVLSTALWVIVALLVGHVLANRRAYVAAIETQVRLAEQTREEHARRLLAEERLRIARELHDLLAHTISVINVQAGVASHVMDERPDQAREALMVIKTTSKEALQEMRGMLGVLRQSDEPESRTPAPGLNHLDALIQSTIRAGLPTRVATDGQPYDLPPTVDLAAYRIIQESLTNALRYAGPATAVVTLSYERDRLVIEVNDTGRGYAGEHDGTGSGIIGMRERAATLGGVLEAGPRLEGGFRVRACLPVKSAQ